jgi:hypothetical protein
MVSVMYPQQREKLYGVRPGNLGGQLHKDWTVAVAHPIQQCAKVSLR